MQQLRCLIPVETLALVVLVIPRVILHIGSNLIFMLHAEAIGSVAEICSWIFLVNYLLTLIQLEQIKHRRQSFPRPLGFAEYSVVIVVRGVRQFHDILVLLDLIRVL